MLGTPEGRTIAGMRGRLLIALGAGSLVLALALGVMVGAGLRERLLPALLLSVALAITTTAFLRRLRGFGMQVEKRLIDEAAGGGVGGEERFDLAA